jgi:hypothetical protein
MVSVRNVINVSLSLVASLFLLHCDGSESPNQGKTEGPPSETIGSTAQNQPSFEKFKASLEVVEPGVFKVEGDILLNEADLPAYFAEHHENPQALTVKKENGVLKVWSTASRFDLKYCVSNAFGDKKPRIVEAMAKATRAWQYEAGAGLAFRYASDADANCTTTNTAINISVEYKEDLPDVFGDAWVGPQLGANGREYNRIRIAPASFDGWQMNFGTMGVLDLASVAAHELGHVLGFYHEHDHPGAGACNDGANFNDGKHESLTGYDPASIMHCTTRPRSCTTASSSAPSVRRRPTPGSRRAIVTAPASPTRRRRRRLPRRRSASTDHTHAGWARSPRRAPRASVSRAVSAMPRATPATPGSVRSAGKAAPPATPMTASSAGATRRSSPRTTVSVPGSTSAV